MSQSQASFTQRITFLFGVFSVAAFILLIRLFQISVIQHQSFVAEADEQQNVEYTVLPKRGTIYAQDLASGSLVKVAVSSERYALSATPRNVTKKMKAAYAKALAPFSDIKEEDILTQLNTEGWYMRPLAHGLTSEQLSSVAEAIKGVERAADPKWKDVPVNLDASQGATIYYWGGVFFQREYQRSYPQGNTMGQVLGFVNDEGLGKYGIESEFDQQLKGQTGKLRLEQDSLGTLLRSTQAVEGSDGADYELTIDRNIQHYVEQELEKQVKDGEAKGGVAVVMDAQTGGILAMANYPSYDPAKFREVPSAEIGRFTNGSISTVWEPGSVFKPIVMASAIDQGLVTPDTKQEFGGSVNVGGFKIETALRRSYGEETMTQVLVNSDNVGMVWVANKLGNDTMHDYLHKFGIGQLTGIDLANEVSTELQPAKTWRDVNRATLSFGQGISVTPLQLMQAYTAITSKDGTLIHPHILQAIIHPDGRREEITVKKGDQVLKPETAAQLREMLKAVVEKAEGPAKVAGYGIAGKTGTAQVPDLVNGGYLQDQYNHTMIGFAPASNPRYILLTKIEQPNLAKVGTFAVGTAVPLFGRISRFLIQYLQIPPTP